MSKGSAYDHVFVMSSDIRTDRRMQRTISSLSLRYPKTLIVCRNLGLQTTHLKLVSEVRFISTNQKRGPFLYLEMLIRYIILLSKVQFTSITCVDADTILVGAYFKKRRGTKTFYDAHELFSEVPELSGKPLKKRTWRAIEKLGMKFMDVSYTVNETLARELTSRYNQEFKTVRNLPEAKLTSIPYSKDDKLRMVYLGVVNKGRGLEEIIRCIALLEGITLDIVGSGDIYDEMKNLSDEMSLSDTVHFHGWCPADELNGKLANKDIGLNLLDAGSQSYQSSLANKFFDYIHAGIPVLTMDFDEYRKYCSKYDVGWLLQNLDVTELSGLLNTLKQTKSEWLYKRDNCLKASTALNWEKEFKILLQLHDS